jgi:hypothetical protein
MTTFTITQLQALGIDPKRVAEGVTFQKSGFFYQNAEFLTEKQGIKFFRTTRNGKLRMLAQEQMIAIFS